MIEVRDLVKTCEACPAQWEFRTNGDRPVYVRYRSGYLSICIGPPGAHASEAVMGTEVLGATLGHGYDGCLEWETVEAALALLSPESLDPAGAADAVLKENIAELPDDLRDFVNGSLRSDPEQEGGE